MNKLILIVALAVAGYYALLPAPGISDTSGSAPLSSPAPDVGSREPGVDGNAAIDQAYARRLGNLQVEGAGVVSKVLADDHHGSRHQRFIVRLPSGLTVLVAHNIDLAPRIETLRTGDSVRFYGEYEWNAKGGVLHWTHHDPQRRHPGGWIEHAGRRYE